MSKMRDECIALEAAWLATLAARSTDGGMTFGAIAEQAIARVDAAAAAGELGLLYRSWVRDPDRESGGDS